MGFTGHEIAQKRINRGELNNFILIFLEINLKSYTIFTSHSFKNTEKGYNLKTNLIDFFKIPYLGMKLSGFLVTGQDNGFASVSDLKFTVHWHMVAYFKRCVCVSYAKILKTAG
jgi:hypothetical protein